MNKLLLMLIGAYLPIFQLCSGNLQCSNCADPFQGFYDNGHMSITLERYDDQPSTEGKPCNYIGYYHNKINGFKCYFECCTSAENRLKGKIRENNIELALQSNQLVLYVADYKYFMARVENK